MNFHTCLFVVVIKKYNSEYLVGKIVGIMDFRKDLCSKFLPTVCGGWMFILVIYTRSCECESGRFYEFLNEDN